MTTLAPTDKPTNRFINKLITGVLPPTAAKDLLPAKRPTTATSAELNNCCRMLLAARGRAKISIFLRSGPLSISICLFFCADIFFSFIFTSIQEKNWQRKHVDFFILLRRLLQVQKSKLAYGSDS